MVGDTDSWTRSEEGVKTRSLIRRAVSIVLATQVVCAVLLGGAALVHERHTRFRAFDTRLEGRSDSLLGAIQDAEDPEDNVLIDPTELRVPDEDVYAVYNQGGRLLGTSPKAPAALTAPGKDEFRDVQVDGRSYRVLQREALRVIDRSENGGVGLRRPVTILYASPEGHVWHEILAAASFYLIAIALAALLTIFLVSLLLRRTLQPLYDLAVAAAQLTAPALEFEAPSSARQVRELRPLADVLTNAVARLRESFAKEHRFVGDATHELKTAIAVVRSSVQVLMLKPRTNEEYTMGLGRILEDTQRMEGLVTQMLQLARLEEGGLITEPALDLNDVLQSVVTRLQPIAESHSVRIDVRRSPNLFVRLHPDSAQILISNLLLNAMQHSPPHSSVSLFAAENAQGGVHFVVQDYGHGIGPDALPHIFERFYREDTSRSRETGGAGLGLAICKSITDAAGATIAIESTSRAGTRVAITFIPV